jgi:hypothetical protein
VGLVQYHRHMGDAKRRKAEIDAMKESGPAITFQCVGADRSDPLVHQFLAVCNEPQMKRTILDSPFGECATVCKGVWSALDARGSHGWQFVVWHQSGDYHVYLINGDLQCHPAPERKGGPRMISRVPLAELLKIVPDARVDIVDTPDELVVAYDEPADPTAKKSQ